MSIHLNNISFRYEGQPKNIIENLSVSFDKNIAIVGSNGSGKTTLINIILGNIKADLGSVNIGKHKIGYVKQNEDEMPCNAENIEGYTKSILKIKDDYTTRFSSLSMGERKRLQIASVLSFMPDVLILDEATNHIDDECKDILINALKKFNGFSIIVSHDRYFLDLIVSECLFMREHSITLRHGTYSECLSEEKKENEYKLYLYEKTKAEAKHLEKKYKQNKDKSEKRRNSSLSKRNVDKKDHDAKSKIDAARLTGKDSKDFKNVSKLHSMLDKSVKEKSELYIEKEKNIKLDFLSEKSKNKYLYFTENNSIKLIIKKTFIHPEIMITPSSKIGIVGANGSGKTTLIKHIYENINITKGKVLYIPQEITSSQWQKIYSDIKNIDKKDFGYIMSIIECLGSDAKSILSSASQSPGEMRKIMFSFGLLYKPNIIIMDEPTNHLDIFSIQRFEEALQNFEGALLLISHDKTFIKNTVNEKWILKKEKECVIMEIETVL